jgi:hypothetical protein
MILRDEFNSGAVDVDDTAYVQVADIQADGRDVILRVDVGADDDLSLFKIEQCVVAGGTYSDLAEGVDFNTATVAVPWILGTNLHLTAAGGSFQLRLASGAYSYRVSAATPSNTTATLTGRVL